MEEKRQQPRFYYGYVVTAAGFVIWAIGWGTFTPSFSIFFKPLLTEFGWTRADTSLAYSLSFLVQAGLAIFMGWLTDRLGPRIVITALGSILGICYLVLSRVSLLWQFTLTYAVLGGIGVSTLNVPVMVTVSRWFTKRRGMTLGIVQAGMGLGGFIFSPLTAWLILSYDWRSAYVVLGVITLVGIFTAGLFLKRDPGDTAQLPDGEAVVRVTDTKPSNPGFQAAGLTLGEAVRMSQFRIIAAIYGVFGFCRSAFSVHLAVHVQDLGFSLTDGANVMAVVIGGSVFGRIGLGRVADTIGSKRGFIISFGITALSIIWLLVARSLWMLYLFAFVFGFAWGNQAVLRFTLASEVFGLFSLGLIVGVLGVAESVAAMLGSFAAGYTFDLFGNYSVIFWAGIGISVVGMGMAALLKPVMREIGISSRH